MFSEILALRNFNMLTVTVNNCFLGNMLDSFENLAMANQGELLGVRLKIWHLSYYFSGNSGFLKNTSQILDVVCQALHFSSCVQRSFPFPTLHWKGEMYGMWKDRTKVFTTWISDVNFYRGQKFKEIILVIFTIWTVLVNLQSEICHIGGVYH